jgi:hypothetical protein
MTLRHKGISINWLKVVISLTAIAAIVVRMLYPDVRIDSITLGLMIVAVLPWLSELIESAKLPGGWEIKFRDIRAAGEKVTSAADASQSQEQNRPAAALPSFVSVANQDPNLALVGLRIEIELRVREIAERHDIFTKRRSLGYLIRELKRREILPSTVAYGLDELVIAGNQAAHGARVEPKVAQWAISTGPEILAALDELL